LVTDFDGDDLQQDDGAIWDNSGDELDESFELDREWQRRHDQFHTVIRQFSLSIFLIFTVHKVKWLCELILFIC
jgi:hypothetical protein